MYDGINKKANLNMCMYDVIIKKAKMRRQKHKNMFESVVLIVTRAKHTRAAQECTQRTYARCWRSQTRACSWRAGPDDDEADDHCCGVQILEFEPFRTQIQNTIFSLPTF